MDPKLRPSFEEIGRTLEEIMSRLQEEELERDRKLQPTAKGKRSDQNLTPKGGVRLWDIPSGGSPWLRSGRAVGMGSKVLGSLTGATIHNASVCSLIDEMGQLPSTFSSGTVFNKMLILTESNPALLFFRTIGESASWREATEFTG